MRNHCRWNCMIQLSAYWALLGSGINEMRVKLLPRLVPRLAVAAAENTKSFSFSFILFSAASIILRGDYEVQLCSLGCPLQEPWTLNLMCSWQFTCCENVIYGQGLRPASCKRYSWLLADIWLHTIFTTRITMPLYLLKQLVKYLNLLHDC